MQNAILKILRNDEAEEKEIKNRERYEKQRIKNLKDIDLQTYLYSKRLTKQFSPFADTDKDRISNMFDCYPFDPNRHGVWSWIKSKFKPSPPKPSPKTTTTFAESKLAEALRKTDIPVSKGVTIGKTTITPSGGVISRGGRGGGGGRGGRGGSYSAGTYTSPTGEKFSMSEKEAKKLGAKIVKPTKEELEAKKLEVATPEQLGLGVSVVTAYRPPTKEELERSKKYEEKWYEKVGGWITGETPLGLWETKGRPWIEEYIKAPMHKTFPFLGKIKKINVWFKNLGSKDPLKNASKEVKEKKLKELFETGHTAYKGVDYRVSSTGQVESVTASPFPSWVTGTKFGLEPAPAFQTGEKPSVRYAHMFLGKKIGEKIPEKYTEKISEATPDWLKYFGELATPVIAEAPTFTFFSPFLETGAAKKGKGKKVEKQVLEKPKTKVKVKKISSEQFIRNLENIWKKGGERALTNRLLKYSKEIAKRSGIEKQKGIQNLQMVLQELYNKRLIKSFIFDANTGQFIIKGLKGSSYNLAPIYEFKGVYGGLEMGAPPTPIGKAKVTATGAGLQIGQNRFQEIMLGLKQKQKTIQKEKLKQKQKTIQNQFQTLMLGTATGQKRKLGQAQKIMQVQRQKNIADFFISTQPKEPLKRKTQIPFWWEKEKKPRKAEKQKRLAEKIRKREYAYQPSVGSILLGFEISLEKFKKIKRKEFAGLGLRPVVKKKSKQPSFQELMLGIK